LLGVWIIKTQHAKDAACAIHNGHTPSPTYNANCSSVITSSFAGSAIVLPVALVLMYAMATMKRRRRRT
jgi:heme/copper-type cytochrome/quinol oxidase subunit 2